MAVILYQDNYTNKNKKERTSLNIGARKGIKNKYFMPAKNNQNILSSDTSDTNNFSNKVGIVKK